ncbi:hypothetical protein OQH59_08625, partial [Campylobacter sp. MIT 21-1682]|nr:hypothetical protein [Campylobacter sp. MIT 21-1682]
MLPYLDELIGVDWVMDLNMLDGGYSLDEAGKTLRYLYNQIKQGKLKDPRDKDSTKESREEFRRKIDDWVVERYDLDIPNEWTEKEAKLYMDTLLLVSKIMAVTPPQGYPNAPTYFIPEYLEEIYKEGELDKKQNPTIPAIYRENFPEYLRKEIEDYAR